jgi:hypothetical protein
MFSAYSFGGLAGAARACDFMLNNSLSAAFAFAVPRMPDRLLGVILPYSSDTKDLT